MNRAHRRTGRLTSQEIAVTLHWMCLGAASVILGLLSFVGTGMAAEDATDDWEYYYVGPGDNLEIAVRNEPELSSVVIVRPDGHLSMPLIDDLAVTGLTPPEVKEKIQDQLRPYINDPMVTVTVVTALGDPRQRIRVIGEAAFPVSVPYRSGITVIDAITEAGGLAPNAGGNSAKIIRRGPDGQEEIPLRLDDLIQDGDMSANVALRPGDVLVIPEGFFSGDIFIDRRVFGSETFTDNVNLDPDGDKKSALITRIGTGLTATANLARFQGAFDGNISGLFNTDRTRFSVDGGLIGTSTSELIEGSTFFDFDARVQQAVLDAREAQSGSQNVTTNENTVYGASASPYYRHRLGRTALAEWRLRGDAVMTDSGSQSNTYGYNGSVTLNSGPDFTRFFWGAQATAGQQFRSQEDDIEFASVSFSPAYAITRHFDLIGTVGYDYRTGGSTDEDGNVDDPTWRAGFRYTPNEDAFLEATYGQRYGGPNIFAALSYDVGPRTSIRASYTDVLETSQERFLNGIDGLAFDPEAEEFVDPITGEPAEDERTSSSFSSNTTRDKLFQGTVRHQSGLNSFIASGNYGMQQSEVDGDEDFYGGSFGWARDLTRDILVDTRVSYEHREFTIDSRDDDTYRFNAGVFYQIYENTDVNFRYSFQMRDSNMSDEEFTENTVSVGFVHSF